MSESRRKQRVEVFTEALIDSLPPYSFEYISAGDIRWRIRDSRDDAVGSAYTEQDAKDIVWAFNKMAGIIPQ